MTARRLAPLALAAAVVTMACQGSAQTSGDAYRAPRTADGQPDLQGVWANNAATPLQRPAVWAGKQSLNDAELAQLKAAADKVIEAGGDALFGDELINDALAGVEESSSHDATTGNYNHFWLVGRDFDRRTSLIVDPEDGRLPPHTPAAEAKVKALAERRAKHPADGPESRGLGERCLAFGMPRFQAGYNSYYQLFQSKDHVVVYMEMAHDARVVPIDGRPRLNGGIRQWLGDSRGHWDGETLVIETGGFSARTLFMGAASENLSVVERFTRVAADTLRYEVRIEDPTTWTAPWTAVLMLKSTKDKIYEFACHEGNMGMVGILAGARAQEADAGGRQ